MVGKFYNSHRLSNPHTFCIQAIVRLILLISLFASNLSDAYEVNTHVKITEKAIGQATNYQGFIGNFYIDGALAASSVISGSFHEDDSLPLIRVRNHFYDPVSELGLNIKGISIGKPSLVWGFKDVTPLIGNDYSWTKAREYMYIALTGKNFNGDPVAITAVQRNENFQTMFRSIGQVMHLVQDLASPAHVRNDSHLTLPPPITSLVPSLIADLYEKFVADPNNFNADWLNGYQTVKLNQFSDYWKNVQGLAIFTNHNFISQDTNFNDFNSAGRLYYSSPQINHYTLEDQIVKNQFGTESPIKVDYGGNTVHDQYTGQDITNDHLTAFSVFDFKSQELLGQPVYSVNDFTMQSAANILVRRAVGYSAGILDYFFRGSLETEGRAVSDEQGQINQIRLFAINATANESIGPGMLQLAYQFKAPGTGTLTYGLSGETFSIDSTISAGADLPGHEPDNPGLYAFTLNPPIPVNATEVSYRMVFRGKLGAEEDAVVAQPVHFPVTNFYVTVQDCCTAAAVAVGSKVEVEYYDTFLEDFQSQTVTVTGSATLVTVPVEPDEYLFITLISPDSSRCTGWIDEIQPAQYQEPSAPYVTSLALPSSRPVGGLLEFNSATEGVDQDDPRHQGAIRLENVNEDGTIDPTVPITPYFHFFHNPQTQMSSAIAYRITRTEITSLIGDTEAACTADGTAIAQVNYTYDYSGETHPDTILAPSINPSGILDPDGIYMGSLSIFDQGQWLGLYATFEGKYRLDFTSLKNYLGYQLFETPEQSEWRLQAGCDIDHSDFTYFFPFNSCMWFLIIRPEAWAQTEYSVGTTVRIDVNRSTPDRPDAIIPPSQVENNGPNDPRYYQHRNVHETAILYNNRLP